MNKLEKMRKDLETWEKNRPENPSHTFQTNKHLTAYFDSTEFLSLRQMNEGDYVTSVYIPTDDLKAFAKWLLDMVDDAIEVEVNKTYLTADDRMFEIVYMFGDGQFKGVENGNNSNVRFFERNGKCVTVSGADTGKYDIVKEAP